MAKQASFSAAANPPPPMMGPGRIATEEDFADPTPPSAIAPPPPPVPGAKRWACSIPQGRQPLAYVDRIGEGKYLVTIPNQDGVTQDQMPVEIEADGPERAYFDACGIIASDHKTTITPL